MQRSICKGLCYFLRGEQVDDLVLTDCARGVVAELRHGILGAHWVNHLLPLAVLGRVDNVHVAGLHFCFGIKQGVLDGIMAGNAVLQLGLRFQKFDPVIFPPPELLISFAKSVSTSPQKVWLWPGEGKLEEVEGGAWHRRCHGLLHLVQSSHLAEVRFQEGVKKGRLANVGAADKVDVARQRILLVFPVVKNDLDQLLNVQASGSRYAAGGNNLRESTIFAFSISIHEALLHEISEQCNYEKGTCLIEMLPPDYVGDPLDIFLSIRHNEVQFVANNNNPFVSAKKRENTRPDGARKVEEIDY